MSRTQERFGVTGITCIGWSPVVLRVLPEDVYAIAETLRAEAQSALYPRAGFQALIASRVPHATAAWIPGFPCGARPGTTVRKDENHSMIRRTRRSTVGADMPTTRRRLGVVVRLRWWCAGIALIAVTRRNRTRRVGR